MRAWNPDGAGTCRAGSTLWRTRRVRVSARTAPRATRGWQRGTRLVLQSPCASADPSEQSGICRPAAIGRAPAGVTERLRRAYSLKSRCKPVVDSAGLRNRRNTVIKSASLLEPREDLHDFHQFAVRILASEARAGRLLRRLTAAFVSIGRA